jgi:hypothetical protein
MNQYACHYRRQGAEIAEPNGGPAAAAAHR